MIFVTVGTHETPFDRLLAAVGRLETSEELVVQHGASALRPARAVCHAFIGYDQLVEHVRAARVVIMHAGVGSIIVSLANGKRPVAVPRLERYGEHVDDHQLELGRRLAQLDLITLVEDLDQLAPVLAAEARTPAARGDAGGGLAAELAGYLRTLVAPGPTTPDGP